MKTGRRGTVADLRQKLDSVTREVQVKTQMQQQLHKYMDHLTGHRICLCGVDNKDPNQVYAFTIYPRSRELVSYFVVTTHQWSMVRERYVLNSQRAGLR